MAHKVVDIYLKDRFKVEPEKEVINDENIAQNIIVDQEILKTYVGDFELNLGFIISVTENNGQLSGQATGQSVVSLTPLSTTEFKVEGVEAKIEFIPNGEENIKSIKLHQNGQIFDGPRSKPFDKTSINLSDFTGHFYSEELSTAYEFMVEDEKLIARHSRLSDIELSLIKKDVFSGNRGFFNQIEFIRDANNAINGCKVSAGRVRNLYFQKLD